MTSKIKLTGEQRKQITLQILWEARELTNRHIKEMNGVIHSDINVAEILNESRISNVLFEALNELRDFKFRGIEIKLDEE
ncbi:MAG: hypothetical protein LBM02_08120 [Lachnospiraceae bacterium]|jgi:hypothetical protein|nr:hypothetical protein [Lachnospiraceae bacterium]